MVSMAHVFIIFLLRVFVVLSFKRCLLEAYRTKLDVVANELSDVTGASSSNSTGTIAHQADHIARKDIGAYLDRTSGKDVCPSVLVKRCRYCKYDKNAKNGGCGKCFKLSTAKGWEGTLCTKAHLSSKCTGEGFWHSPPKCKITEDNHGQIVDTLVNLADKGIEDPALQMWDDMYLWHNMCNALKVQPTQNRKQEGISGKFGIRMPMRNSERFANVRHQDKMLDKDGNERTVQEVLYESLKCDNQWAEKFDENEPRVVIRRDQDRRHKARFENVFLPVSATGKSGAKAMKTHDELFRLKAVDKGERDFWDSRMSLPMVSSKVGTSILDHWAEHPLSSFAKFYAIVNVRASTEESSYFGIMRNVFAGIDDLATNKTARIYDLKGSNRKCKGKQKNNTLKPELCGDKGEERKEQDFDEAFPDGLALPAWGQNNAYNTFFKTLFSDIAFLKSIKVHDYSLVLRVSTDAKRCLAGEDGVVPKSAEGLMRAWQNAPQWQGVGIEMCAMLPSTGPNEKTFGKPVRISATLLDFLQDSTTTHNMLASLAGSAFGGSKIESDAYAERLAKYLWKSFRPFSASGLSENEHGVHGSANLSPGKDFDINEMPNWLTIEASGY